MKTLFFLLLIFYAALPAAAQSPIQGRVVSQVDNQPLPGVNILVQGTLRGTTTDAEGKYSIHASPSDILSYSFIGYATQEIKVGTQTTIDIAMVEDISTLQTVTIVSTGYEQLPQERATGSFVQVDNDLVSRRVSTDVLSRLEDVTSGLIFNRNVEGRLNDISVRGRSTIFGNATPLIVIDNFPFDGDLSTINPNDVETITVLKDAAAASIWGARAGNGVIIITTKKGAAGQRPHVSFNSNVTVVSEPDAHYVSRMSSNDFIGVEKMLFNKGYYQSLETSSAHAPLTPAVEFMIANRDGQISNTDLERELSQLGQHDVRDDYQKYLYRNAINQQYAINLNGGSVDNRYFLSLGYDKNLESLVGNSVSRITLNANNSWSLIKEKLDLTAGLYYANARNDHNNVGVGGINYNRYYNLYPYAQLRDSDGSNLPVTHDYRAGFVNDAPTKGLLDWQYSPLDEIRLSDNASTNREYRINGNIRYAIARFLKASILYQYWSGDLQGRNYRSPDSYYVRNLVNNYTQDDGSGGLSRIVPLGGILDNTNQRSISQSFRGQLDFNHTFGLHQISALAGYEAKNMNVEGQTFRYYGYDDELGISEAVDYNNYYQTYGDGGFSRIPNADALSSITDRFISYYANASYTFNKRYILSASARKDQSNLFGVKTNQRGVPLWSAGLAWVMSDEAFFKSSLFPFLKLRTTYGYNGNTLKSITAYTTAYYVESNLLTGLPYAIIQNPPNPSLRWEKVGVYNAGLDFEMKDKIISGSVEFYLKNGSDLIGSSPFAPSTGVTTFIGNNASTRTKGIDLVLNSVNVDRAFKWNTTVLLSSVKDEVVRYKSKEIPARYVQNGSGASLTAAPLEGKPLYSIYSYGFAGLDPENGAPIGMLDGQKSTDYNKIVNNADIKSVTFHGSAIPTMFGSLRNTLSWKNISFSFNLAYRLGYYFRRQSVRYANVLSGYVDHGDFAQRWQKPGDELTTSVPSVPDMIDYNRDMFYLNSSALVEKGDHIRFQDATLSYTFAKGVAKGKFDRLQLYAYANNLGVIWKATDSAVDPDYPTMKPARSIALGLRIDF